MEYDGDPDTCYFCDAGSATTIPMTVQESFGADPETIRVPVCEDCEDERTVGRYH